VIKTLVWVIVVALASSCSSHFATDGEHQYLNSKNGQTLVVPAPLTNENSSHFYDLPSPTTKKTEVSIAPPSETKTEKRLT
jgi:uncharacterized lipoprotein